MNSADEADGAAARAALQRYLKEGALQEARALAAQTAQRSPDDPQSLLLHADILEHLGQHEDALAYYEDLRKRFPRIPLLAGRTAIACAMVHRADDALRLYREEVAPSRLPESRKTLIARRIANQLRRSVAAAEILAERAEAVSNDAGLLRDAGIAAASAGDFPAALRFLDASHTISPLPVWMQCVRLDAMQRLAPTSPEIAARLGEALIDALRRDPHEPLFVRQLNRLHLPEPTWGEVYALVREIAAGSQDSFVLLESTIAAMQARDLELAQSLLDRLVPRDETMAARIRPAARLLRSTPPETWQRARLADDVTEEMQVVRVPDAVATLIVFLTVNGNFMMMPIEMLDALLADIPANVVYLRDTSTPLQGAKGFASMGTRVDDAVAVIRATLAELGAPRTVAVGASASGLSAIRYGARLGVDQVVTFAPLTSFDIGRKPRGRNALRDLVCTRADRFLGVAEEAAGAPGLAVDLYYGADSEGDHRHADRVAELPGFRIIPVPDIDHHFCALEMLADGSLVAAVRAAALSS